MRRVLTAVAVALSVVASFSAYAASDNYSFSNGGGEGSGIVFDSCSLTFASVDFSRTGTHNLNAPSATGLVLITFSVNNFCTGSFLFISGSTTNFQFEAPGAPNGIPQSVKASGTIAATCFGSGCPSPTDTVTFSIAWQSLGTLGIEEQETVHTTAYGVTRDGHSDYNMVHASGTVTLTSANLGTLPVSNWFNELSDEKTHTITISH